MYEATNSKYGVVSTLTYGVQWDRTLAWIASIKGKGFSLLESTDYGNYADTELSVKDFNKNSRYLSLKYDYTNKRWEMDTWKPATEFTSRSGVYIMTTGALSKANLCNIYDLAGNIYEWTMERCSTNYSVPRGGYYYAYGYDYAISARVVGDPTKFDASFGFRPSLYIK